MITPRVIVVGPFYAGAATAREWVSDGPLPEAPFVRYILLDTESDANLARPIVVPVGTESRPT
jgi:hypothetical protein